MSPKINIESVDSVSCPVWISWITARQTPFLRIATGFGRGGTRGSNIIDGNGKEGWKSRRVDKAAGVKVAIEGILVGGTWVVRDLNATSLPGRIVVDVKV